MYLYPECEDQISMNGGSRISMGNGTAVQSTCEEKQNMNGKDVGNQAREESTQAEEEPLRRGDE